MQQMLPSFRELGPVVFKHEFLHCTLTFYAGLEFHIQSRMTLIFWSSYLYLLMCTTAFSLYDAGGWTQWFVHVRPVPQNWAISPVLVTHIWSIVNEFTYAGPWIPVRQWEEPFRCDFPACSLITVVRGSYPIDMAHALCCPSRQTVLQGNGGTKVWSNHVFPNCRKGFLIVYYTGHSLGVTICLMVCIVNAGIFF